MQIRSLINKLGLASLFFVCANVCAQVSNSNVTYALVDHEGVEFDAVQADQNKGMFFRRTRQDGSVANFRVPEFDSMNKKHNFTYELLDGSLVSTAQGDYFVVESMRSIASNPEDDADYVKHPQWWKHRCGHGVNLTYLVGVVKKKIKIEKKYLTECVSETRVFNSNGQIGYEIKGYGNDAGKSVLYLLQKNGSFIRKVNGPYKETP
jgi:hypothetical protein